jgi:SPP1 family predicted phage head-tail adaptor
VEAGKLRHQLTLEQATDTLNARGEAIPSWSTVTTLWGSIDPLSGREGFAAQQMYASATHRIRLRYRAGVVPKMRLTKGARVFKIEAVLNTDERNRELVCLVTEGPL